MTRARAGGYIKRLSRTDNVSSVALTAEHENNSSKYPSSPVVQTKIFFKCVTQRANFELKKRVHLILTV